MKARAVIFGCALITIILLLGGCSFKIMPINELIRAPKLMGENAALQEAFEGFIKNAPVTLKTPAAGDSRSAYVFHDIDGDGVNEAFVFYAFKSDPKSIRMNMLVNDGRGRWESVYDEQGAGSEVFSVDFVDLNSSGEKEVLVSWQFGENRGRKSLSVFACEYHEGKISGLSQLISEEQYVEMLAVDMDVDGKTELFLVNISPEGRGGVRLLGLDPYVLKGTVDLDLRGVMYKPLKYDFFGEDEDRVCRVYIDTEIIAAGEPAMITEIIKWNKKSGLLFSPLYTNDINIRMIKEECRDFDGDGIIEIPGFTSLYDSSIFYYETSENKAVYMNSWSRYLGDGEWSAVYEYIENPVNRYRFDIPEEWKGRFAVYIDAAENSMTFFELDSEKKTDEDRPWFNIHAYTEENWKKIEFNNPESRIVQRREGIVYVCEIFPWGYELPDMDMEFISGRIWFYDK